MKILSIAFVLLMAVSLVLAGNGNLGNSGNLDGGIQAQSQVQAGIYVGENGQNIQIQAQENNKFKIKAGNVSAECSEKCNMTQEQEQNRTKFKMQLSNGRNAEIKVMPDVASETALARLRLKVCSSENNCSIELKEVGQGNETKAGYEMQIQRHFRVLGMFRTKAQVKAEVNAENGEIISVKKPWWAFLATEPEE
jgi:translation elongation factor EF-1alpha